MDDHPDLPKSSEETFIINKDDLQDILSQTKFGDKNFKEGFILQLLHMETVTSVALQTSVTVGRPLGDEMPEPGVEHVVLNVDDAHHHGVSRKHMMLSREGNRVMLTDMNSANGTRLNGYPLVAGKPRILRDGDEVYMGKLSAQVRFVHHKVAEE
jgi:pSer/pThr/pTyr-binding forkhead associated (FHA) protein